MFGGVLLCICVFCSKFGTACGATAPATPNDNEFGCSDEHDFIEQR